jgi:hypothetical protein
MKGLQLLYLVYEVGNVDLSLDCVRHGGVVCRYLLEGMLVEGECVCVVRAKKNHKPQMTCRRCGLPDPFVSCLGWLRAKFQLSG